MRQPLAPSASASEHVLSGPHTAIEQHFATAGDGVHDARQRRDGGASAVELTSAVVGHHHRIHAVFDCELRVLGIEDSLDDDLARPALAQPGEIFPGDRRIELAARSTRTAFSRPPVPFMRASRLPKVRRRPVSTLSAQVGRIATSNMFLSVSLGGMDRPFFGSRRRRPCTGMSTVSMMAEQLAASARSSSSALKLRSRMR